MSDRSGESPIFLKTYDYTKWLLEHTMKFPKSQRFVMAKRLEETILDFYDLLLSAVKDSASQTATLMRASFELEKLKQYMRLCRDLNLLSLKQYEYSSKMIVEIGKLLGGWLKKSSRGMG